MQFRNQYTITKNISLPGIIKTYGLENYRNGYALVMEISVVFLSMMNWENGAIEEWGEIPNP